MGKVGRREGKEVAGKKKSIKGKEVDKSKRPNG